MDPEQAYFMFSTILYNSKLTVLRFDNNNISSVDPQLLARAVSNIEHVHLESTDLTTEQVIKIVQMLATDHSKTKVLNLANNDLASVDPELLEAGIKQLKELNLFQTNLTVDHFRVFYHKSLQEETNLKIIDLRHNCLIKLKNMNEIELKRLKQWREEFTGWLGLGEDEDPTPTDIEKLRDVKLR